MNRVFKNIFLLAVFFVKNDMLSVNTDLVYQGNKDIAASVIKEISQVGLDKALYESLLTDIEMIINQSQQVFDQVQKNINNIIENKENIEELVLDYKCTAVSFNKLTEWSLVSKEKQASILGSVLFGVANMLAQKTKMQKFLSNEQVGMMLFFMSAMGIEFTSLAVVEKIMTVINKSCSRLKTDDLNNFAYEATLHDILHGVAQKIIDQELCGVLFDKIIQMRLNKMKEQINLLKNQNNKGVKKSKNKK
jgi:hypothetical protein